MESVEDVYDEVDGVRMDAGVELTQVLSQGGHQIVRPRVVRLLADVILRKDILVS